MKKNKGFSLVELIVSMAIVAILSTFMIVNFVYDSPKKVLKKETQEIVSNLKEAQAMAVSGEKNNGIVPAGGYGVYFVTDKQYYLYADLDENRIYNSGDTIIKTINLSSDNSLNTGKGYSFLLYNLADGVCFSDGVCGGNENKTINAVSSGEGYLSRLIVNLGSGNIEEVYLGL